VPLLACSQFFQEALLDEPAVAPEPGVAPLAGTCFSCHRIEETGQIDKTGFMPPVRPVSVDMGMAQELVIKTTIISGIAGTEHRVAARSKRQGTDRPHRYGNDTQFQDTVVARSLFTVRPVGG
jgi:hypothetical protein